MIGGGTYIEKDTNPNETNGRYYAKARDVTKENVTCGVPDARRGVR